MQRFAEHPYAAFLHRVEKPARYAGGEAGEVRKDWSSVEARVCLAFPDVYDIGMSHLGYKILYKILNDDPRTLAERCYAPWIDMEAELRSRKLPLVSLESARPLSDFDVVGLSLQFELSYTNCLTILDLGGIPLRARDRGEDDPLILGGGPTATHPEPMAPFFDAFVIGDGEERLTEVALTWARLRREGVRRKERLARLAALGGVYVPSLYVATRVDGTGFLVVDRPSSASDTEGAARFPVRRTTVPDLNAYSFPTDGPVGGPEAIFERMSVEVARGCTEGCRFCQAGMIYRPVRERDPELLVATVLGAVRQSGYDEVSLTSLSTADYACISPLVHVLGDELAGKQVALGVSSLRAYGLGEDLLDRIGSVRNTGLTFAPEAGTQRMRDVINKNVTQEQLLETAQRVFSRGWSRMKLYFMIGLPTETDEDVRGIVATACRTVAVGRKILRGRAKVTVSVSSHVPKPHTPFQWCAMDSSDELARKQRLLVGDARAARVDLRLHRVNESILECVFARGDRALADVIEHAWRSGARFDSWQDQLRLDLWNAAFETCDVDSSRYLRAIPLDARLPWDHIDVGLAEGFLAKEHERAFQARPSPPCGKPYGRLVHPATAAEAKAESSPLVCYHCGAACDLESLRERRVELLTKMEARRRPAVDVPCAEPPLPDPEPRRATRVKLPRYRFRFEKLGPAALLGHLDLVRAIPRAARRVGLTMAYSQGFHPKPELAFSPALSLGVLSLGELVDIRFHDEVDPSVVAARLTEASPRGLQFTAGVRLGDADPAITKVLTLSRCWIAVGDRGSTSFDADPWRDRIRAFLAEPTAIVARNVDGAVKDVDVRAHVLALAYGDAATEQAVRESGIGDFAFVLDAWIRLHGSGGVKIPEILQAVAGSGEIPYRAVRAGLYGGTVDAPVDPLDLARLREGQGSEASRPVP